MKKIEKIEENLKKNKANQENLSTHYSNKIELQNQKFYLDENLLEKIQNVLTKICSLNIKELERIFYIESHEEIGTQTDQFKSSDSFNLNSKSEREKTKLEKKYILSSNNLEAYKHLLHEIKNKYSQTADDLKKIQIDYKQLKLENDKLQGEYDNLNYNHKNLKDYIEKIEENIRIEKDFLTLSHDSKNNSINLFHTKTLEKNSRKLLFLTESDLISDSVYIREITKYLGGLDIINLKHANSGMYNLIDRNKSINKQILKSLIIEKNKKIEEISNDQQDQVGYTASNAYSDGNIELENLFKKYSNSSEIDNDSYCIEKNRKEFATAIHKSIEFVLNDIKKMIKNSHSNPNNLYNSNPSNDKHKSTIKNINKNLLGSVGSILKNVVNQLIIQTEDTSRQIHSLGNSTVMKEEDNFSSEISSIDQYFLNFKRNENNFYFSSPLELKSLIYSTFFRLSNPQSTETLNIYIEEISLKFSHLLFFSIDAIKQLIELRILSNHLSECLNDLGREKKQITKENREMYRDMKSLKYINSILINERDEINKEIRKLKQCINTSNKSAIHEKENSELITFKYRKMTNEYEEMKYYYRKEVNNLESDLATMKKERNEAVNILINLKTYSNIFNETV